MGGECLELVDGAREGKAGDLGDLGREGLGEAWLCVQSGADGGSALRQFSQSRQDLLDALDAVGDLLGVAGELVAKGERRSVLQMGTADLDDIGERLRLRLESAVQLCQGREKAVIHLFHRRDMHGRRKGVVRRLAAIDVVVGMYGRF